MAANFGIFPKALATISGIIVVPSAIVSLFSSPAGFLISFFILALWGLFLKMLVIVFYPEDVVVFTGEKPPRVETAEQLVANITARQETASAGEEPPGRVLEASHLEKVHKARIIGGACQKTDPRSEEQKENAEWADMMRSL
jgi:hypothetical protein